MSTTGMGLFDSTLQKTAVWLNELTQELDLVDRHAAYSVLRTTLHALRDRLTADEAVQLGAQLPMLVRGFYYEGWSVSGKPVKQHRAAFLAAIGASFAPDLPFDPEDAARAVFGVLARHVSAGEMADVGRLLPKDLRDLWPSLVDCTAR